MLNAILKKTTSWGGLLVTSNMVGSLIWTTKTLKKCYLSIVVGCLVFKNRVVVSTNLGRKVVLELHAVHAGVTRVLLAEYWCSNRRICCEMFHVCKSHQGTSQDRNAELGNTDKSVVDSACRFCRSHKRETILGVFWCLLQMVKGPLHEACHNKSYYRKPETIIQLLWMSRYIGVR